MKIGFDIDGVLADFNPPYMDLLIEVSGRDLFGPLRHDPAYPHIWLYPGAVGYTRAEEDAAWQRIRTEGTFWRGLSPLYPADDVLRALRALRDAGHDLYFVTSRPGWRAKHQTEEWLEAHGLPGATVLICSDKAGAMLLLGLDAYIDDKLGNVNQCARLAKLAREMGKVYLLDRPWNQEGVPGNDAAGAEEGVIRIRDPREMLAQLEGYGWGV